MQAVKSPHRLALERMMRKPQAVAGAVMAIVFLGLALASPIIAPYPYDVAFEKVGMEPAAPSLQVYEAEMNSWYAAGEAKNEPGRHLLGLDSLYRDVLSRVLYGARVSLLVGVAATIIALVIGIFIGSIAGYFGGIIDNIFMRVTDTFMAFPSILLAIAISAVFRERSVAIVFIALGLVGWTNIARIVRGQVLTVKGNDYVTAARALGAGNARILLTHVLPNSVAPIIVIGTLSVAGNILAEAGLSFLGVGVQPPVPSWGNMLRESLGQWDYPWMSIVPGLAIMLAVLGFNLLGDGLRDALDPRMKI